MIIESQTPTDKKKMGTHYFLNFYLIVRDRSILIVDKSSREGRATLRSDPSALSGSLTDKVTSSASMAEVSSYSLYIGGDYKAINLRGLGDRVPQLLFY